MPENRFELLSINGTDAALLPHDAGLHDIECRLAGNRLARFTLSLPTQLPLEGVRTLVVVLHYAGQPTRFYGRPLVSELFEPAWRGLDAVFVAPESLDGQWTTAANEAFVVQLIELLQAHYALNHQRTVVAGYSMGAIGTWHFITHYPERFAAAVPLAGIPRGEAACNVPVYTLATANDEIFDYEQFSARVQQFRDEACPIKFATVTARGHYDIGGFATALAEMAPWLQAQLPGAG